MADVLKQYRWLERLPVEKLEELLRQAVDPQSEEEDSAYIDAILEVIVKKEKEQPTGRVSDVGQAWTEFQEFYHTEEGIQPHYTEASPASQPQANTPAAYPRHVRSRPLRRMLIAAAVIALLVAALTVPAFGSDSILQALARWTTEQFYFVAGGTPQKQAETLPPVPAEYEALQEALAAQGVDQLLVLRDIPEGFVLDENDFYPFDGTSIDSYTTYTRGDDRIMFDVHWSTGGLPVIYEKDDGSVEVVTINGTDHYFFTNLKIQNVAWISDGVEYSLGTTLPKEELQNMLNSVYEV